jgi:hypothetical protein
VTQTLKPCATLTDFITGRQISNIGAEENRQAVARFLVENKGYGRGDIEKDVEICLTAGGEPYRSQLDLVVSAGGARFLVVKCAAGSLASWERETLAAARLLESYRLLLAAVSDGRTALVTDTLSGRRTGEGLTAIPSKGEAESLLAATRREPFPAERREREGLIFRTYDRERVNRPPPGQ